MRTGGSQFIRYPYYSLQQYQYANFYIWHFLQFHGLIITGNTNILFQTAGGGRFMSSRSPFENVSFSPRSILPMYPMCEPPPFQLSTLSSNFLSMSWGDPAWLPKLLRCGVIYNIENQICVSYIIQTTVINFVLVLYIFLFGVL